MKKSLYILVSTLFVAGIASGDFTGPTAGFTGGQGFKGASSGSSISKVKDVKDMYDDQIATVKGNITKRLSDDKYLFKDESGEMVVEIDYKYWAGVQVDENDVVELTGKVDKEAFSVSLDAFKVKKVE